MELRDFFCNWAILCFRSVVILLFFVSPLEASEVVGSLHIKKNEWVAFASGDKVSGVKICLISELACKEMERLSAGFYVLRNPMFAKDSSAFIVESQVGTEVTTKVYDFRKSTEWGKAQYVILGALIGFASTLFLRMIEALSNRISTRFREIDQLKSNLVSVVGSLFTSLEVDPKEITIGMTPFGIGFLNEEISDIKSILTQFSLKSKNINDTSNELKILTERLTALRKFRVFFRN